MQPLTPPLLRYACVSSANKKEDLGRQKRLFSQIPTYELYSGLENCGYPSQPSLPLCPQLFLNSAKLVVLFDDKTSNEYKLYQDILSINSLNIDENSETSKKCKMKTEAMATFMLARNYQPHVAVQGVSQPPSEAVNEAMYGLERFAFNTVLKPMAFQQRRILFDDVSALGEEKFYKAVIRLGMPYETA
ncbi:hypothetical protein G9A89_015851 [Geosiphon pyriformis]|nr:hypothetical protein G9A89_015850 [Geosiphon pyriformis]KAG9298830.1 hypothetical protein G9A89_015851 [Geosiphon pyriformis]